MNTYKTYYKRNLPHYQPLGYTFIVTFRLAGSVPVSVINKLKIEKEKALKLIAGFDNLKVRREKYKEYQSLYFGKFDKLLDGAGYGPTWLQNDNVAQVVKDAMHYSDKKSYDLICYTIMSNHVHLVFTPITLEQNEATNKIVERDLSRPITHNFLNKIGDINVALHFPIVTDILRKLKGSTARECNKLINRSGTFWQHESYDHVVRDKKELIRIVKYVLNNPVKAGLCEKWEDWKWNYCNLELLK